jgi:hypothetical protein
MDLPGTVEEQLAWLRDVGFAAAECVYRELQTVILIGIRDQLGVPSGRLSVNAPRSWNRARPENAGLECAGLGRWLGKGGAWPATT